MDEVLSLFCDYCNVYKSSVKSRSREQHLVAIRQVFSKNMRKDHTLKEIGAVLNRKYNTIIHALKPKETKGIIHKDSELTIYYQQIWDIMEQSVKEVIDRANGSMENLHNQCVGIIKMDKFRGLLLEYYPKINYAIYVLITPLGMIHTHYGTITDQTEVHLFPDDKSLAHMKRDPHELKSFYDKNKL